VTAETEYQTIILDAEREAASGRYKDAYNTLGHALTIGGPDDRDCRYRRGVYALRVGQGRLDTFEEARDDRQLLVKASAWLSRSHAYLDSSREGASEIEIDVINQALAENREAQKRFRELFQAASGEGLQPVDDGPDEGE
jgi:hypothetical protein